VTRLAASPPRSSDKYQKVASMEVQPGEERVTLRLQP
jgi:hypothetical protein